MPEPVAIISSGKGPPLVLLHGGTGSRSHWRRNIDALAAQFRVHALDLPGFGDAPDAPPQATPAEYLQLIHAALASLAQEGPLRLAGFSFGGAVAAACARRLGPDCAALALIGPGGFGSAPGRALGLRRTPPPDHPDYRATIRHNLLALMLASPAAADDEAVDLQIANIARSRFESRTVSLEPTLLADLAAASAPAMAIWGEADRLAWPSVPARAELVRQARPDIRVEIIPQAGHWAQYENPAAVNALLLDFLTDFPTDTSNPRPRP